MKFDFILIPTRIYARKPLDCISAGKEYQIVYTYLGRLIVVFRQPLVDTKAR